MCNWHKNIYRCAGSHATPNWKCGKVPPHSPADGAPEMHRCIWWRNSLPNGCPNNGNPHEIHDKVNVLKTFPSFNKSGAHWRCIECLGKAKHKLSKRRPSSGGGGGGRSKSPGPTSGPNSGGTTTVVATTDETTLVNRNPIT